MFPTHDASTDLILPDRQPGEQLDPHLIYTYAWLFTVPHDEISVFAYVKCKPYFSLSEGGLCVFRGLDNLDAPDMAFMDYQMTMPWPQFGDNMLTMANGLRIEILEPGKRFRLTYRSPDGKTSVEVESTGVTDLLARGHVIPGEDSHGASGERAKGGSEQMMRNVGHLVLDGHRYEFDSVDGRDRSWGQTRSEYRDALQFPPAIWTPVWYDDLAFNQVGYEAADTDPSWAGVFDVPTDAPTFHNAWVIVNGEVRQIESVHLNATARHPYLHMVSAFEVSAVDSTGATHELSAEAIGMTALPTWNHSILRQALYRWTDSRGRIAYNSAQEMWWDQAFQHAMNRRSPRSAHLRIGV